MSLRTIRPNHVRPNGHRALLNGEKTGKAAARVAGAGAGAAAGAAVGSVVPVVGTAVGAVVGGIAGWLGGAGVESAIKTKKERVTEATEKVKRYKINYYKCKARRNKKGKKAWPADTSTSVFSTNCRVDYKKWREWQSKLGEASEALESALERQQKLDKKLEKDLERDVKKGDLSNLSEEERKRKVAKERKKRRAKAVRKAGKKGELPTSDLELTELEEAELLAAEEEADNTILYVGAAIAGVVLAGGITYTLWPRS